MVKKIFFLAAMTAAVSANAQNVMLDNYEAVDLGLSVYWATCNVGADKPENAGDYFMWGQTTPVAENQEPFEGGEFLDSDHDAATQIWGGKWRMPTADEFYELKENCNWNWNNEKKGYDITSKNGNSIFLPAAGSAFYDSGIDDNGTDGYYWSSSDDGSYEYISLALHFHDSDIDGFPGYTGAGFQIRPVYEKPSSTALKNLSSEKENVIKTFENGQIVIIKNGEKYNLSGKKL